MDSDVIVDSSFTQPSIQRIYLALEEASLLK